MDVGKKLGAGLVFLTLGLLGLGCAGGALQDRAMLPPEAQARKLTEPPPIPDLRIPEPTVQPAAAESTRAEPAPSPPPAPPPSPPQPTVPPQAAMVLPPTQTASPIPPVSPEPSPVLSAKPAPTASSPPELEAAPLNDPAANLRRLYRLALERSAQLDSYNARLRRREQVKGKDGSEEIILFQFRREPFSVHMKWLGQEGQGREVVYVQGQYEDKIHTLLARTDNALFAGKVMSFAPDNPLVKGASRHPITDAGIANMVTRFGTVLEGSEKGDKRYMGLRYLGVQKRPESLNPVEAVELAVPPGNDPLLPKGGHRLWLFDTQEHVPMTLITWDDHDHEVEYYCFDCLQCPVKLDDDDFNPARMGNKK
jgi:hypothetical protein